MKLYTKISTNKIDQFKSEVDRKNHTTLLIMAGVVLIIQIVFLITSYYKPFTLTTVIIYRYRIFYLSSIGLNITVIAYSGYTRLKHGPEAERLKPLLLFQVIIIYYWAVGVAISDMFQGERIVIYYMTIFFIAYFVHFSIFKIAPIFIGGHLLLVALLIYLQNWFEGSFVVIESSSQLVFFTLLIRYYLDELYKNNFNQRMEIEEKNKTLEYLCYYDALSNLLNRRSWEEKYHALFQESVRTNTKLSVIIFDIDYFKQYNDHYGHVAGDQVIRQVSDVLSKSTMAEHGFLGRYGGDEFIYASLEDCDFESFLKTIQTSIESLKLPHIESKISHHVTLSHGLVSRIPDRHQSPWHPVILADQAMYDMKKNRHSNDNTIYAL